MNYMKISNFGPSISSMSNPLGTCAVSPLDAGFNATLGNRLVGPDSSQCQQFMSSYCANNWDGICEYQSNDMSRNLPNTVQSCNGISSSSCMSGSGLGNALTKGQLLIRNSAQEKYLKFMSGNCTREYQPFDPTVADSPLIGRWKNQAQSCGNFGNCNSSNSCIPIYGVDEKEIDNDPLMNKILQQPWIAMDILVNMYNNYNRTGKLAVLGKTKLYRLFTSEVFQNIVKSKVYNI